MDPFGIGIIVFGFCKLIQFITKEEDHSQQNQNDANENTSGDMPTAIPYNPNIWR